MGIEPTPLAWKAKVLPLNYTRINFCNHFVQSTANILTINFKRQTRLAQTFKTNKIFALKLKWWWGLDSNQRTQRERIYSPSPLTTRPPHQQSVQSL